ncbi:hypothetical protein XENORESO_003481, partial [Xenotaenia resolanae]
EQVFNIALEKIQSMRTIRPKKDGKIPAIEIHFGNAGKPQNILLHLKEAKELCHMLALTIEELTQPSLTS